ncbi:hypothetical protein [Pararhodobacter sp. CCB-MM2]|uniref:hypothetical protein n=1 Tax=Pararhodobacter sp. CCB-MM2 TaxID=1786003 RepID=UPI0008308D6E|nr:hypothetical protein [Pararhodobacter sp. CCB-MM2]MCA2011730.1 hypothetical protein [Cereibacter sphaeroides]
MRFKTAILALGATLAMALPASAACYADYRAQQNNPVRFHYGVAQIPDNACGNVNAATQALRGRLASGGWTLVNVLSTFGDDGLSSRRANAGSFYLRY